LPQVVELFLVSFISIFVGISFCAPIYLALIYSHAFNKKTSGTTTCTGVYLVATVGLLIYVVPSLVAFVEATGGDVSKAWLMWTTDPFANAVTASLLWDILLIAVALAFVQVMHFSRAVSRLPAPIFLVTEDPKAAAGSGGDGHLLDRVNYLRATFAGTEQTMTSGLAILSETLHQFFNE